MLLQKFCLCIESSKQLSRAMRKCVLCHMRTTKAQISLRGANNNGADQPAHPRSLISAFVVRCLDSIISLDSIAEISRLASFCGCAGRFVSGLVENSRRHVLWCRGSTLQAHPIIYLAIDFFSVLHARNNCSNLSSDLFRIFCLLVLTVDVRKRVRMWNIIFSDAQTTLMKE